MKNMRYMSTFINGFKNAKAKKIVYATPFHGMPTKENFQLVEEDLGPLKDGEYLAEAVYLSVDPYMRAYSNNIPLGSTMIGSQVAKIIESKNVKYPVGKHIIGEFGWRNLTKWDNTPCGVLQIRPYLMPEVEGIPLSLFLGMLGMTGNSAYFGFLEVCKPKPNDTVVVSGAAGAVGSHVGQIAKIKGCKVIGLAGTDEKCNWLKEIGFDHAINYKSENLIKSLYKIARNGIDCYFDNVGGEISSIVMNQMNKHGRISVCGSISSYNAKKGEMPKATIIQPAMVLNELYMEGFVVNRFLDRWMEGVNQNIKWFQEGKIICKETITEGFENIPKALNGILEGENTGKAIVKV